MTRGLTSRIHLSIGNGLQRFPFKLAVEKHLVVVLNQEQFGARKSTEDEGEWCLLDAAASRKHFTARTPARFTSGSGIGYLFAPEIVNT